MFRGRWQAANFGALRFARFTDVVVKAWQGNATFFVVHARYQFCQRLRGVMYSAAKQTGMQITVRSKDADLKISQTAQTIGDSRRILIDQPGVRIDANIRFQQILILFDELSKIE